MAELFDRTKYFDAVRGSLFSGTLTQQQVDGQNAILADWEGTYSENDLRWLAYALATTIHETASTMWPIEEYGKGAGQPYGVKDPETGQTYFGRGFVQLTWRANYANASKQLGFAPKSQNDFEWTADNALDPFLAGHVMFRGMIEGWFRSDSKGRQTLERYFSATVDDAYGAREIINGDKSRVPSWSSGVSIGNLIKGYHGKFLAALKAAQIPAPAPQPEPEPAAELTMVVALSQPGAPPPKSIKVSATWNGEIVAS